MSGKIKLFARTVLRVLGLFLLLPKKLLSTIHKFLLRRFFVYRRWVNYRFHRLFSYLATASTTVVLAIFMVGLFSNDVLALSTWTQSDWSGGTGSSTSNQYSSDSNVTTSTANQITLNSSGNLLTNPNFSSGLTGWYAGVQPSSIGGLALWLKADAITGVSNNTKISTWSDSSGSSHNATQANSSYQPTYLTSGINGLPTLLFSNSQYLATANLSIGSSRTEFVVFQTGSDVTSNEYIFDGNGGNTDVFRILSSQFQLYNGSILSGGTPTANTNYIGSVVANGGTSTAYINGTSTISGNPGAATPNGYSIGDYGGSGPYGFKGDISEMIVYSSNLSSTQRAEVEDYLASKYGITVSSGINASTGTSTTYNGDADSAELTASATNFFSQNVNVGNTNSYELTAYAYNGGSAINSSVAQLQYNDSTISTTYTSVGGGWYELSGSVTGVNSSVPCGVQVSSGNTIYLDGVSLANYSTSGSLTSNIYNTGLLQNYGNLTYSATVPSGSTVSVLVRSGNQSNLSDAPAFTSCSAIASGGAIESSCAPNGTQYVQYELEFTSNGTVTPTFTSISITYSPTDTQPPSTNASNIQMYDGNGGTQVSADGWAGTDPYITWTAATDHAGGSGIAGYCLYIGQSSTGNPITTSGDLGGTSPLNTGGACPFAISTTDIDTSISGYLATALTPSTSPYYFNIAAITGADYTWNWTNSPTSFEFYFDNSQPTNPAFITAPSEFVSTDDVTLTWPTTGSDAASDAYSGVAGLQYRIGANGIWYGANHNGNQDMSDLLPNNGTYTTVSVPDYNNLQQGDNIVYFRTWSNSGVASNAYVTTVIKINTTAPSSPQNLTATPSTNTTNSFGFSWLAPATYTGSASNITYCYTINVLPTSTNCTFTAAGQTSLSAGAYATEPGDNTIYVVAKDEAGNINYATASSTTFTANTPAPGIPLNPDIADISVKLTSTWKLAVSWSTPSQVGAGIANYRIYRSTDGTTYSEIATTAGTSYVDTGLSQQTYYYEIQACDSANNCGSFTSPVSDYPTGKFTSPANLISGPNASVTTTTATITWTTDRDSDSSIEYGKSSNNYFSTQASNSNQVTSHSITLNNLSPGTTYYFRSLWTDTDGNTGTSAENIFTTLPAPSVSNVTATNVNLTQATINFTTTNATAVQLEYGGGALSNTQTLNTSTNTSSYSIPLSGLAPGTVYSFKLNPYDTSGNLYNNATTFTFTTPPQPTISSVQFSPVNGALTGTEQVTWTTNVPASTQISYGLVNGSRENLINPTLTTSHSMTISDLSYDTQYSLTATSVDALGNVANSDLQIFKSGIDTRPPIISSITIQPSIVGTGASAKGQMIISWKTDKPGTSQVQYGNGGVGDYTTKTAKDSALVNNHTIVITGLATSEVYHVQIISADADNIVGYSADQVTIIGQSTDNALGIIFNALQGIFGL